MGWDNLEMHGVEARQLQFIVVRFTGKHPAYEI